MSIFLRRDDDNTPSEERCVDRVRTWAEQRECRCRSYRDHRVETLSFRGGKRAHKLPRDAENRADRCQDTKADAGGEDDQAAEELNACRHECVERLGAPKRGRDRQPQQDERHTWSGRRKHREQPLHDLRLADSLCVRNPQLREKHVPLSRDAILRQ